MQTLIMGWNISYREDQDNENESILINLFIFSLNQMIG